ncbi:MAG: choice-of-anchor D domain-containing protein [Pseudomonadota bacterium]|nr:choice-of-anchor D domain-containing protein [Pseudomonadota bacterium]
MRRSILFVPLFVVACTPDYDIGAIKPDEDGGPQIEVDPTDLYFGTGESGAELAQTFTITSIGAVAADITDVIIDGGEFALTSFTAGGLAVDDSMDVVITYTATGEEDFGTAEVFSDDADSPHIVTLNGGGLVPELTITPDTYNYGYVGVGESAEADFALRNTGGATLEITALSLTESVFTYTISDSLPLEIEPGDETTVTVTFTPDASEVWSGQLQVGSNDPAGMKFAELSGSGAGDQPIAVCYANPDAVEAIHEDTTWYGNDSYDPAGYAITNYAWTLTSAPSGSSARMPSGGANRPNFTPDLAGTYIAELVVTNELGDRSEPCTATLEAIPGGDLWIEIFWTHSGDDMDLHLLKPGGSLVGNGDCYYGNCAGSFSSLDWGVRGDPDDDPVLDIDDIPGTGPENINIDDPENGTFTVYVHDYPGSVYNGNNDVTMNIYIGGLLEWTDTRNVNEEDLYKPFAEIDWPAGTVTDL